MALWTPDLDTQQLIEEFMKHWMKALPYILGVDEFIEGCVVQNMDPYAVGTFPRYISVSLRGYYHQDVFYRGGLGIAVADTVTVIHFRDGDRYEVLAPGGSTGTPGFLDPTARGDILRADATPAWALRALGAANSVLYSDGNDPQWGNGFTPVWTALHEFRISDAVTNAITEIMRLTHYTSGAAAAWFGAGLTFHLEDDGGGDDEAGILAVSWNDPAAGGNETAQLEIRLMGLNTERLCGVIVAPESGVRGNARGYGAVDLQTYRSNNTDVASGDYSAMVGGQDSEASGDYSAILGGRRAKADKYAQVAHAGGYFANPGEAQSSLYVVWDSVNHNDATWRELYLDGAAAQMTLDTDTVWTFDVLVVGTNNGCTKSFSYRIEGCIENDGGNTTILASTVTTIYDADDPSFDARVSADNATDALLVEVRDADGTGGIVRWVARVRTAEVTF